MLKQFSKGLALLDAFMGFSHGEKMACLVGWNHQL